MTTSVPIVLASHKRQIIDILVNSGLTPSEFEWEDSPSENRRGEVASILRHRKEPYYFRLDRYVYTDNWAMIYCPGDENWTDKGDGDWDGILSGAKAWASYVARELDATDYNAIMMAGPQLLELPRPGEESDPITGDEREFFSKRLDDIERYILNLRKGSSDFESQVRSSLKFLRQHAKHSDRRSFYALVYSTLLAIGLNFLTPTETKEIIQYANTRINIYITAPERLSQTATPNSP